MSSRTIQLKLVELHPAQQEILRQARRFNVVCCGRRWGKTHLGMDRLIHTALKGQPTAWFSPNYRLMEEVWRELQSVLGQTITRKNEQEKRLELIGGGVVELWSLENSEAGRSRKYALVIIDEAAFVADLKQSWQAAIRPALMDLRGQAWFLSTPKGGNHFKVLFDLGQDPEATDWSSWQMPTSANPFIDPDEIEAARRDCTESTFNQEYLARFVNQEGSVFRRVEEAVVAELLASDPSHDYVIGCDWGRTNDYTVFVVVDAHTRMVVAMDRSNRVDYATQCGRLRALSERWQPKQILAEQNSIGQPIIEQLVRDGLPVQPFLTTSASKTEAIQALALAFERGDIRILQDQVLISELLAYEAERTSSGLMRYGAPQGQHDDCVMALAIAWRAVGDERSRVYSFAETEFLVPPFPIPKHWERAYGMDYAAGSIAVIWAARDPNTEKLYFYDECVVAAENPQEVADVLQNRCQSDAGVLEPEGHGRSRDDGLHLIATLNKYYSLSLVAMRSHPDSGVMEVSEQIRQGQVKVFANLSRCIQDWRNCRRDARGTIVTAGASLAEAARCVIISDIVDRPPRQFPTMRRVEPWSDEYYRRLEFQMQRPSPGSWMG